MSKILVIAEHHDGKLNAATAKYRLAAIIGGDVEECQMLQINQRCEQPKFFVGEFVTDEADQDGLAPQFPVAA